MRPTSTRRRIRGGKDSSQRRGTVTVLVALLMVPFLGMVAFALDIAWIVQSRSDLQSAADSAALAGAEQLTNGFVQYSLPGQTLQGTILSTAESNATTCAKNFASYNTAGGVSSLTLNNADVQFGFTDASNNFTPAPAYSGFPNTVKVTVRLDSNANGQLKLFFAPIFGLNSTPVTATAAATIFTANIVNFQDTPSSNAGLLPMTMDVNDWNTFMQSGVSSDGTTHTSANGAPQMQVYPSPTGAPGNFGMLSLDDSSNSASAIKGWIANGLAASDITALQSANLLPLTNPTTPVWNWKGVPGFKASDLNSLPVGQNFLLPIFEPVVGVPGATIEAASGSTYQATDNSKGTATPGDGGKGSNAYYNIVKFVGVQITTLDKSTDAYVQPAAVMDTTAVFDQSSVAAAGTTSTLITTFTTPKLTQ
jgi:Flp pilus assembly protein TadG